MKLELRKTLSHPVFAPTSWVDQNGETEPTRASAGFASQLQGGYFDTAAWARVTFDCGLSLRANWPRPSS